MHIYNCQTFNATQPVYLTFIRRYYLLMFCSYLDDQIKSNSISLTESVNRYIFASQWRGDIRLT